MKEQWLQAAQRYAKAKLPGFKARKKRPQPQATTLSAFLANGEGEAALSLLNASDKCIALGYADTADSKRIHVLLDGEGLLKQTCRLDDSLEIVDDGTIEAVEIELDEALVLLRSFPKEGSIINEDEHGEEALVLYLRHMLDDIVREAP